MLQPSTCDRKERRKAGGVAEERTLGGNGGARNVAPAWCRAGVGRAASTGRFRFRGDGMCAGGSFIGAGARVILADGDGAPGDSVILLTPKEPGKLLNLVPSMVTFLPRK